MQVGLVTGRNRIELIDMPQPEPTPGKAVVDIGYCGICGTDLHAYLSGEPYNPAICGHEWAGVVSAVGQGENGLKEGDRVAIGVAAACGHCRTCRRGDAHHCETVFISAIGMGPLAASHGGFASAIAFAASRLYQVPDSINDEDAAILEPVAVAVHALRRTHIQLGDSVAVIGAGPIGLLVLQAAKAAGAGHCFLLEPVAARRELGGQLGADTLIDPSQEDAAGIINGALNQDGCDLVFECAGVPATIQQAANLVRRGGLVSLVGVANHAAEIDAAGWLAKEIRLSSSIAYLHEEFEIAKELVIDGRIRCAPLHTSTVGLNQLGQAFAQLASHPAEVKILVDPRI